MFFQNLDKRDLLLVAFFSGLTLILFSVYLTIIIPMNPVISNHSNLNSTIIALELIENKGDLDNLIGTEENPKFQIYSDSFLKSVNADNFYIFIYGLYFLSLFEIGYRNNSFPKGVSFVFYALLIFCMAFDISENYKIQSILNAKSNAQIIDSIQNLRCISLSKWFLIFLISGLIGVLFWLSEDGFLIKVSGLFLFTSFISSIPGLQRYILIEIASFIMFVGLFLAWIYILEKNYHFLFRKKI